MSVHVIACASPSHPPLWRLQTGHQLRNIVIPHLDFCIASTRRQFDTGYYNLVTTTGPP